MTETEINITIAKFCGLDNKINSIPLYTRSLDALRMAEEFLNEEQQYEYSELLIRASPEKISWHEIYNVFWFIHLDAYTKSKAFVVAINKKY